MTKEINNKNVITCKKCGKNIEFEENDVKIIIYKFFNPISTKTVRAVICPYCNNEQEVVKQK